MILRAALSKSAFALSLLATLSTARSARAQSEPPAPPEPPSEPEPPIPVEPAVASGTIAVAPSAPADRPQQADAVPAPWKPMMQAGAGLEVYWFSAQDFGSTFAMIPYAMFELSKGVLFDLHLPLSVATNTTPGFGVGKSGAGIGNPTIGLTYVKTGARTSGHIGARISLPLAGASDAASSQGAIALGAIAMVLYDIHYWASKYVPIGMRVGVEHQAAPGFFIRGELEPTMFVPTDGREASVLGARRAVLLYQMRAELEGRGASGWGGGFGAQLVHVLSESNGVGDQDNAQGALEPFVSYDSATTFARLGLLLAVDPPLGIGLDKDKVATLRLNVGSHF